MRHWRKKKNCCAVWWVFSPKSSSRRGRGTVAGWKHWCVPTLELYDASLDPWNAPDGGPVAAAGPRDFGGPVVSRGPYHNLGQLNPAASAFYPVVCLQSPIGLPWNPSWITSLWCLSHYGWTWVTVWASWWLWWWGAHVCGCLCRVCGAPCVLQRAGHSNHLCALHKIPECDAWDLCVSGELPTFHQFFWQPNWRYRDLFFNRIFFSLEVTIVISCSCVWVNVECEIWDSVWVSSLWVLSPSFCLICSGCVVALSAQKKGQEAVFLCPFLFDSCHHTTLVVMMVAAVKMLLLCYTVFAAYTDEFLQAFNNLGLDQWAGIEMDVAWGHATSRYGLHRPSITGPIFVYRWAEEAWHVTTIDSTRGHSRDRSLMHPCYVLIHADDCWAFNQRPHGLVELVVGDRDLSFPCILPQMINFPIVQAFLAPLVPGGLDCVAMNVWYNGAALDFRLVNCFDGFFVQVAVSCCRTLLDNIITAAPILVPQLHVDPLVLPDSQFLQVSAYVPGGDALISSRSVSLVDRRDRVYAVLHAVLRQRFPDMLHVGFEILTVHPSSTWLDPTFGPQKEKVVIVYTDDFLRRNAAVLLRLSFPPYEEEGAIYTTRRLRLRTLVRQLGLSPLCGHDGDNCLCFVNGNELANDFDAAVEDAAFISCWMLPLTTSEEVELVSIADSASVRSLVALASGQEPGEVLSCPPPHGTSSTAAM